MYDEFKNVNIPMKYTCSCGREAKICLSSFLRGNRCWQCGLAKRIGKNHWNYQPDQEALRARKLIRKKYYKALQTTLAYTGQPKWSKSSELLGYGCKELRERIESHPNWPLVKDGKWDLDHIFPVSAFVEYGISDIKLINALDNLQPLSKSDNSAKRDKYSKYEFESWLKLKSVKVS